jgi:predicted SAM-dependent methyltransferase
MSNRLLLGSGDWHWPGWTTVDANPDNQPSIVAVVPPLPPQVRDKKWDEILMVHAIEHIAPWKALELAKECYAALSIGGVFILEQPDIYYCASVLLGLQKPFAGAQPGQADMWGLYGNPETKDEWMLHRWGYTPNSMLIMLTDAGFERDNISFPPAKFHVPERDFRVEARK